MTGTPNTSYVPAGRKPFASLQWTQLEDFFGVAVARQVGPGLQMYRNRPHPLSRGLTKHLAPRLITDPASVM